MRIEDWAGKLAGGLEVIFHHPLRGFKDYHMWVDDAHRLCRGSWPTPQDITWLKLNGINISVNLCKERNQDQEMHDAGIEPENIPVLDGDHPTIIQANGFLKLLGSNRVYVHCEAGHGRTGCMCAYYRVNVMGWTPAEALQEALFIAGHLEPNQVEWIKEIK